MRRLLAVLTVLSLASLQSQALAFHVHAVPDHVEEAEGRHHHGPAIHHHEDDLGLHMDAGDASVGRVIDVTVPAAVDSQTAAVEVQLSALLLKPRLDVMGVTCAVDARSHGPPLRSQRLLRGPPTSSTL